MARSLLLATIVFSLLNAGVVRAQPSPDVQRRISAAIKAAANSTNIDYTAFVNPFIGTGDGFSFCSAFLPIYSGDIF